MKIQEFYSFKNGGKISDRRINSWIQEVYEKLKSGKPCASISSGDTRVCGFAWDTEYEIVVANRDGYSVARIYRSRPSDNIKQLDQALGIYSRSD